MVNSIVLSSGHGKYVRGASGILDEVDEARRVVDEVAKLLQIEGVAVKTFHDNTSQSQDENLHTIVDYHNSQQRDLDISVHFNAYEQVSKPMGTEVLFTTQEALAEDMSAAICLSGFINRGAKLRNDLYFLNNTDEPAILIETCFVDSSADADLYTNHFNDICNDIVTCLTGGGVQRPAPVTPQVTQLFKAKGKCSHFGGPNDQGVDQDEGLAFIYNVDEAPYLFLPETDDNQYDGLARRLNPLVPYVACRWDYNTTPKEMLTKYAALVKSVETGVALKALPADWGPHQDTGRVADLSPGLMDYLNLRTDDEVEVIFPYEEFDQA